jgi:hypothetical protein
MASVNIEFARNVLMGRAVYFASSFSVALRVNKKMPFLNESLLFLKII